MFTVDVKQQYNNSPVPSGINGYKLLWNISGTIHGIENCKNKSKSTAEVGHSSLLSVYKSSFAQMPVSQENINMF